MLGHRWRSIQVAWPNGLRHRPCRHCVCPKWCLLSVNHYQGGWQRCTSRRYNHQRSPQGGELLPIPPQIKPLPWAMQVHRTMEDLTRKGGEVAADLSVAQGVCRRRQVHSHHVRRVICPGLTPSVPPPAAPEGTQPQRGGWPRSTLCDAMRLVAKFHSSGWKKDLEHVLQVYYKYNTASFKEVEWARLKEKFFEYFLPYKEEALGLKERCPMDFMAYIEDHFYKATGLHLDGLRSFTAWIKQGSYYHRLVARQGGLHECPHLAGVPLPRWPQVTPSESCRESQMKADTQTASFSRPSVGATAAPVTETPVAEAPVDETLGAEVPVVPSDAPAPMETGGVGDGQSWVEQMEAGKDKAFQRSRPAKRARSQFRRREPRPPLPFPLQDSEGRLTSISQLYEHAAVQPAAHHNVAGQAIMHLHPNMLPQKATCLGNQVACMIVEYHLTGSA